MCVCGGGGGVVNRVVSPWHSTGLLVEVLRGYGGIGVDHW